MTKTPSADIATNLGVFLSFFYGQDEAGKKFNEDAIVNIVMKARKLPLLTMPSITECWDAARHLHEPTSASCATTIFRKYRFEVEKEINDDNAR